MRTDAEYARQLDQQDELARFRDEFVVDDPELIYLDGNSLGRLPKRTQELLAEEVEHGWGRRLIRAWNEGWFEAPERVGGKIARLIGAKANEVIVADSTSVNMYKLAAAACAARPGRSKLVTDDLNFPSDKYILQGMEQHLPGGLHMQMVESPDGLTMPLERIEAALDEDTALLTLSHTAFKSGFTYDMVRLTEMAHRVGALVLWDLSHSAGALPVRLNEAGADLAVGCSYKYLNGGPGAPAFMYVHQELQPDLPNPVPGWFAQKDQFAMDDEFEPVEGMRRYLTGTPPTLSLLAIEPGIDLLLEAGIERLRAKSVAQTDYLIELWQQELEPLGFQLKSPYEAEQRGSHVALGHEHGLAIDLALIRDVNVLPDFRPPDIIRLGVAPIYTTFAELHEAVARLKQVVQEGIYEQYLGEVPTVT